MLFQGTSPKKKHGGGNIMQWQEFYSGGIRRLVQADGRIYGGKYCTWQSWRKTLEDLRFVHQEDKEPKQPEKQ